MTQGVLPFQYEVSAAACGMTALAGLPAYLDLAAVSGLTGAIRRHLKVSGERQGWTDEQVIMSLVLLNLAGGECVNDLKVLEGDEGFARVARAGRVAWAPAQGAPCLRAALAESTPSSGALAFRGVSLFYRAFHDAAEEAKRVQGRAFIPAPTEALQALYRINQELVAFKQAQTPQQTATLDMDATLVETYKHLGSVLLSGVCGVSAADAVLV
jgi:hypothetical protein